MTIPWLFAAAGALRELASLDALLVLAVRSSGLLLVGWLAATLLRRAAPPARQVLWASVLAGLLVLPAATAVLPAWRVLPTVSWGAEVSSKATEATPRVLFSEPFPLVVLEPSPHPAPAMRPAGWRRAAALLWASGTLIVSLGFLVGLARLRRLRGDAESPAREVLEDAARLAREFGVARRLEVAVAPRIETPATWGVVRPIVVLPRSARGWSRERTRLVLAHEIAHVARYDFVWRLVAQLGCAAYWFNPLAWLAARRLRLEQELACDLAVVRHGARPSTYAHHLLSIACAVAGRALPLAALDMARRGQMEGRLMSILSNRPAGPTRRAPLLPALSILVALPVLAAVEPRAPEPPREAKAAEVASAEPVLPAAAPAPAVAPQPVVRLAAAPSPALAPRLAGQDDPALAPEPPVEADAPAPPEALAAPEPDADWLVFEQEMARRAEEIATLMEPLQREIEHTMREEMEPLLEQMRALELEMEPAHDEMSRIGEEMSAAIEAELGDLDELLELEEIEETAEALAHEATEKARLRLQLEDADPAERERVEAAMREVEERLRLRREEMRALRPRIEERHRARADEIRLGLEPQRERLEALRRSLEPQREQMERLRAQLEPIRQRLEETREARMNEVRERLETVRQEMEALRRERESRSRDDSR